jgi:hypothetical protein
LPTARACDGTTPYGRRRHRPQPVGGSILGPRARSLTDAAPDARRMPRAQAVSTAWRPFLRDSSEGNS